MTLFGWDASDYDWDRGARPATVTRAAGEGISFFTHKISEGTKTVHDHCGEMLKAAVAAKVPFVGAYVVPRTPGNSGHGDIKAQVAFAITQLDRQFPEWKTTPGFFIQVDLEKWSYDAVSPNVGIQMVDEFTRVMGRRPVLYAPRWAYGDTIGGIAPLWASNYGSNVAQPFKELYASRGGDTGEGWSAYSGRTPKIWQYGSNAVIGGQRQTDANAFRGTVEDFRAMIGATTPPPAQPGPTPTPKPSVTRIRRWDNVRTGPVGASIIALFERYYPKSKVGKLYVTSANDSKHGTVSHHYGLTYNGSPTAAIDFGCGSDAVMGRDLAQWIEKEFGDLCVELIHSTPFNTDNGFYIRHGKRYPYNTATKLAHRNHVHLAMSKATVALAAARLAKKYGGSAPPPAPTPPATAAVYYTVVSGDTLGNIAKRFSTTVAKIVSLNGSKIKDPDHIEVGWRLRVK